MADGTIYLAVGIFPFEGTFIYALDAETGQVLWLNDGTAFRYADRPHGGAISFSGPTPQGYCVALDDKLLVPCGRAVPACFDRHTGKLLHYRHADNKQTGDSATAAMGDFFFCNGQMFELATGKHLVNRRGPVVLGEDTVYDSVNIICSLMTLSFGIMGSRSEPQKP